MVIKLRVNQVVLRLSYFFCFVFFLQHMYGFVQEAHVRIEFRKSLKCSHCK